MKCFANLNFHGRQRISYKQYLLSTKDSGIKFGGTVPYKTIFWGRGFPHVGLTYCLDKCGQIVIFHTLFGRISIFKFEIMVRSQKERSSE